MSIEALQAAMSADMPPLPNDHPIWSAITDWGYSVLHRGGATPDLADAIDSQVQAYARAYARSYSDDQVKELVEALKAAVREFPTELDMLPAGYSDADIDRVHAVYEAARALIEKHEKQA